MNKKHDYCLNCDCILRYDESDICCSCEDLKIKELEEEQDA